MKTLIAGIALTLLGAAPVLASHANPWMQPGDTVLAKNHETNQAFSADRPGEDEMRGRMVQNVSDKAGQGRDNAGGSGGQGGSGHGGGGHGGGGKGR